MAPNFLKEQKDVPTHDKPRNDDGTVKAGHYLKNQNVAPRFTTPEAGSDVKLETSPKQGETPEEPTVE
jgi:hypothetical protein